MATAFYFVQVSLYAAAMWAIYAAVWRNKPLHRHSRVYLLASLVLPTVLPLVHLPLGKAAAIAGYSVTLPAVGIGAVHQIQPSAGFAPLDMLVWLYLSGAMLLAFLYTRAYIRIRQKLRGGYPTHHDGYTILTHTGIGPGTLGRRIFFPSGEVDPAILRHELAHIDSGHRYDSLLLQIAHVLFWMSPAHWIIGRELKTVHEFDADRLASAGLDMHHYASLLLSHSFGAPHPLAIAHSFFHHPLKRRITMLQKTASPKRATLLTAALLLTVGFAGTALVAQARKTEKTPNTTAPSAARATADGVEKMDEIVKHARPVGEVRMLDAFSFAFRTVDKAPAFDGEMYRWIAQALRYPALSRGLKQEGVCTVQFTVAEDGRLLQPRVQRSSGYGQLDDEALRVVRSMPAWKPGVQNGKTVAVSVSLPVYFSLVAGGC